MDKEREIRFLYPPLILLTSIMTGLHFDESLSLKNILGDLAGSELKIDSLTAILGLGSFVLVFGFILGTLTVFLLRLLSFKNRFLHEIWIDDKLCSQIQGIILKPNERTLDAGQRKREQLYTGATFDHAFIDKGIHEWIVRRWNSFYVSANSTVALILSLIMGTGLGIKPTTEWLLCVLLLVPIFGIQSYVSWRQTMKMIAFQVRVKNREYHEMSDPALDKNES